MRLRPAVVVSGLAGLLACVGVSTALLRPGAPAPPPSAPRAALAPTAAPRPSLAPGLPLFVLPTLVPTPPPPTGLPLAALTLAAPSLHSFAFRFTWERGATHDTRSGLVDLVQQRLVLTDANGTTLVVRDTRYTWDGTAWIATPAAPLATYLPGIPPPEPGVRYTAQEPAGSSDLVTYGYQETQGAGMTLLTRASSYTIGRADGLLRHAEHQFCTEAGCEHQVLDLSRVNESLDLAAPDPAQGRAATPLPTFSVSGPPLAGWTLFALGDTGPGEAVLAGLAAFGPAEAWAVGTRAEGNHWRSLIAREQDGVWQAVPHPTPADHEDQLYAISGSGLADIWAVGAVGEAGRSETLTLHWDGTGWRRVPSPSVGEFGAQLTGISARAPDDAWAVGGLRGGESGLVLHWDGTAWAVVPLPDVAPARLEVRQVSARARDDVWAAGVVNGPTGDGTSLVLHWDGTAWRQVPLPAVAGLHSVMVGLSATAAGVWVASEEGTVLRWDGPGWQVLRTAEPATDAITVLALAVQAPDDLWVGGLGRAGNYYRLLHWDGTTWQEAPGPHPGQQDRLEHLTAAADGSVWVVGSTSTIDTTRHQQVLIARYRAP